MSKKIRNNFNPLLISYIRIFLCNFPSLLKNYLSKFQFTVLSVMKNYSSVRDCWYGIGTVLTTLLFNGSFNYVISLLF
jgi:hypothetical protein